MRSVADDLARELRDRIARLSPGERIHLSLELGEQAVSFYRARHGVSSRTARAVFERNKQIGRRPSACAAPRDDAA